MANLYSVDVFRCGETDVFVATSQDIPGLTLEADTLGGMLEAVMEMVPQLLEQNLDVPRDADVASNAASAGSCVGRWENARMAGTSPA